MSNLTPPNKDAVVEFGDFQTPIHLAERVCSRLQRNGASPKSILEPTCGVGNFLVSALQSFTQAQTAYALDINPHYLHQASEKLSKSGLKGKVDLIQGDFFAQPWEDVIRKLPEPILIIGNPPWVTNTALSILGSKNLPTKSNFKDFRGFDAISGRSNFDISEWMIIKLIESSASKQVDLAMLCKTSVARNALEHLWSIGIPIEDSTMYMIDAKQYFSASVDACLLHVSIRDRTSNVCHVFSQIDNGEEIQKFGYRDKLIIADVDAYERTKHLAGEGLPRWRSGIKHDSSRIMELREENGSLMNGLGEKVDIESSCLFPMLKSSDLANSDFPSPSRWMLVTQKYTGDDTNRIANYAPRTWEYLKAHSKHLDSRKSLIYRDRPRFSIFGVGNYSFARWKVAISGLYKNISFALVAPFQGKPVVFDDTCYFLSFEGEHQARFAQDLLASELAEDFYLSYMFWDTKRPITAKILRKLSLQKLATELGRGTEFQKLILDEFYVRQKNTQLSLFEKGEKF